MLDINNVKIDGNKYKTLCVGVAGLFTIKAKPIQQLGLDFTSNWAWKELLGIGIIATSVPNRGWDFGLSLAKVQN